MLGETAATIGSVDERQRLVPAADRARPLEFMDGESFICGIVLLTISTRWRCGEPTSKPANRLSCRFTLEKQLSRGLKSK
jgi:hypothetical protein